MAQPELLETLISGKLNGTGEVYRQSVGHRLMLGKMGWQLGESQPQVICRLRPGGKVGWQLGEVFPPEK
jgi:hypothetical protein